MYWRRPSWFILIATVVGIFCLSSLGIWQLQRAEEKKQILHDSEIQANNTPQNISLPVYEPEKLRYKRIQLYGHYISSKQFVLDNQIHNRKVGYNILTPFKVANTDYVVLVDRGWVPVEKSRELLPEINVNESLREIIGVVYTPFGDPFTLGEIDNGDIQWPRLIQYLDFAVLSQRLGISLQPFTLRLDSDQQNGYLREWKIFAFSPNKHIAYAVQWFALALTLLILFIILHISKSKNTKT